MGFSGHANKATSPAHGGIPPTLTSLATKDGLKIRGRTSRGFVPERSKPRGQHNLGSVVFLLIGAS
jgi:hypothetical protein